MDRTFECQQGADGSQITVDLDLRKGDLTSASLYSCALELNLWFEQPAEATRRLGELTD